MENQPAEFRMKVHLFGAVSSSGCANFVLKRTADDFEVWQRTNRIRDG